MFQPRHTVYALIVMASLVTVACQPAEGPAERAGKAVDQTVQKAGDQVDKTAEKLKDAAQDAKK